MYMHRELPVVAVVPAYNAEQTLPALLPQLLDQEYSDVYVLDDASTDNTVEVILSYGKDVKIVQGNENVGSGANRNRIIPELGYSALIHFLDADVRLNSNDNPQVARDLIARKDIGFVSGLVRLADGTQNPWNYGPRFSLPQMVSSWVYSGIYELGKKKPGAAHSIRKKLSHWSLIEQWPDPLSEPHARDVYWGSEANMVISSNLFEEVGGYDPHLRCHEVMELAMRIDKLGLRRRFDPLLDVTHHDFELLNKGNTREYWLALIQIAGKMSLKEVLLGSSSR